MLTCLYRLEKAFSVAIQSMGSILVSFLNYNIYFLIYRIQFNLIKETRINLFT
jgi:hypothetical protein